jgi:hypothetical protein
MSSTFFEKAGGLSPTILVRKFRGEDVDETPLPRLRLKAKVAYAISGQAIAITDRPGDIAHLGKEVIASVGLCLDIFNDGDEEVTVTEVGFVGRFDKPQLAVHEPLLHDNGPWPRTLQPGEQVIAHMASDLGDHPVLGSLKRCYVRTNSDVLIHANGGTALRFYIKQMKHRARG